MTRRRIETPPLDPDDARLVETLRKGFAPEPGTPARRAAFDAALRARLAHRRRRHPVPALGAFAMAALLCALLVARDASVPGRPAPPGLEVDGASRDAWAARVLYTDPSEYAESAIGDDGSALPPEYAAIASVFLEQ